MRHQSPWFLTTSALGLKQLLWPLDAKQSFHGRNDKIPFNSVAMSDTHTLTLILSTSDNGSLQQVLTDGKGFILVGETPSFMNADDNKISTTGEIGFVTFQTRAAKKPLLAMNILQNLRGRTCELTVLCSPDMLHLPWAKYLESECVSLRSSDISVKQLMRVDDLLRETQLRRVDNTESSKATQPDYPTRVNRHVFSLSYDLVDSTALMARLGAESYALMLSNLHKRFAEIAARWQGQIDLPQGDDGCMCYFGAFVADEHAGLACLQAALEMRNVAFANGWKVRIGIAEGWVAVDRNQPVGLSVHLAARLQKLATENSIMVTKALATHFAAVFDFQATAHTELKGFDGVVDVARLNDYHHALLDFPRPVEASFNAMFVGRNEQLEFLQHAWRRAKHNQGSEHLIVGPPGIGKSTLIRHWIASNQIEPWVLTCGPHDYRNPFAPLAQWIAKEIGFQRQSTGKNPTTNLQTCISKHPKLHVYRHEITYLLDAYTQQSNDLLEDEQARHQRVIDVLMDWVTGSCEKQAVLIVVEDYQWIDASTALWINHVKQLALSGSALMLIVTQRPPLNRQQMYASESAAIQIAPLTLSECRELIAGLAPDLLKNDRLVLQLEENAQGIPLFLKESVRLLQSSEYQSKLQIAKRLRIGLPVPDSLQNLLMERLDQLGPVRQIAQLGSFFGGRFSYELLMAVYVSMYPADQLADELGAACQLLLSEKLWIHVPDSNQRQFEFSHAMIRDVAYQSMWATDRKTIHRHIALVLQNPPWNEDDASAADLGRHLAAAGETDAAVNHLLIIGKKSKKRGAHQVATLTMHTVLELLDLVEPSDTTYRNKIEAHLALAGQNFVMQGYSAVNVLDHYKQALELSNVLNDSKTILRAQMGMQSFYFMCGNFAESHRIMELVKVTALRVKHPLTELQVDWALANLLFYEGKLEDSCSLMEQCIRRCITDNVGQGLIQNPQVMAMMYRAFSLWCLGRFADALKLASSGCDLADAGTHRLTKLQAHGIAAMVQYGCGYWKETLISADKAIASCQVGEYSLWFAHANFMRGAALARLNSYSQGLAIMRYGHATWADHGGTLTRSYYWAIEAELLLAEHDIVSAQAVLEAASEHLRAIPELYYSTEILRLTACQSMQSGFAEINQISYQKLIDAYKDANDRNLHGLSLRVAISLFQFVSQLTGVDLSIEDLVIARQRLTKALNMVQQEVITLDITTALALLESSIDSNIVHIHQYKRA